MRPRELTRGKCSEHGLVLMSSMYYYSHSYYWEKCPGMAYWVSSGTWFLNLAMPAWATRNEMESEHFLSAHDFRTGIKLHTGPESPVGHTDVSSYPTKNAPPLAGEEG